MLDKPHLRECFLPVLCCWISRFFLFLADFSHTQLGRRGVWDSSHYTSTWDGVRSGSIRCGLALPSNARAASSSQGSLNPPVPPSEPGPALYHHLTQHDGPGRGLRQQRPSCGEHRFSHTARANREVLWRYHTSAPRETCTSAAPVLVAAAPDVVSDDGSKIRFINYTLLDPPWYQMCTVLK